MNGSTTTTPRWQSLQVNALSTLLARLLVPALNVVLVMAIARTGGAASLGQYTLLVTIFVLCENIKSLGLPALTVREIAARGPEAFGYYAGLVRIGLAGAAMTGAAMIAASTWLEPHAREFQSATAVLALGLFPSAYAMAGDALFLGIGRATYTLWLAFLENVLRLFGSLFVIVFLHRGLLWLAVVYVATRLLAALTQQAIVRRVLAGSSTRPGTEVWREMMRRLPSFFVVFIVPLALLRLDIVILAALRGDSEVGIYSAAMRLLTVCLIVPDGIMTASFATLSKLAGAQDRRAFNTLIDQTIAWLSATLLPLSVTLALLASFATSLLFGARFAAAAGPARTLAFSLLPFAINRAMGDAMVARGRQRAVAAIILGNFGLDAALYYGGVRWFGVEGAAWAFYLSILVFCLTSLCVAAAFAGIAVRGSILFGLLPSAVCSAVFPLWQSIPVWIMAGISAVTMASVPAITRLIARPASADIRTSAVAVEAP